MRRVTRLAGMAMSRSLMHCLTACSLVVLNAQASSTAEEVRTYRTTTAAIVNPERGFRSQLVNLRHGEFPPGIPPGGPFPWPDPRLAHAADYNLTVVQTYCYLDSEQDELNVTFVDSLDAGFERHRKAGVKSLFRFAYDSCSPGDESGHGNYTVQRVLKHIAQLRPVIRRNADVVMAMYVGFLGCWGEWHDSKYKLENNSTAVSLIVAAVLNMLPPDRKAMLRYPFDKCCGRDELGGALRAGVAPNMQWAMASADSTAPASRLGYDDDGFLCCGENVSHGDGATWNTEAYGYPSGSTWRSEDGYVVGAGWDYVVAESPYVPMDGEMYGNQGDEASKPPVSGLVAAHRLFLHHYDTLSMEHGYAAFDNPPRANASIESIDVWARTVLAPQYLLQWKLPLEPAYFVGGRCASPISPAYDCSDPRLSGSFSEFDYIRDHLGYRLSLESASFPITTHNRYSDSSSDSGTNSKLQLEFRATIVNWGFAAPLNPRPVLLVMIDARSRIVLNCTLPSANVNKWFPRSPLDPMRLRLRHVLSATVPLPPTLTHGHFKLGLWMPDATPELQSMAAYSIRLANDERDVQWWTAPTTSSAISGINVIGDVFVLPPSPSPRPARAAAQGQDAM